MTGAFERRARVLCWGLFSGTSKLTYPICLIHALVLAVAVKLFDAAGIPDNPYPLFAAGYALSLAAGFVLNQTIEIPLINVGRRFAKRAASAATATGRDFVTPEVLR